MIYDSFAVEYQDGFDIQTTTAPLKTLHFAATKANKTLLLYTILVDSMRNEN